MTAETIIRQIKWREGGSTTFSFDAESGRYHVVDLGVFGENNRLEALVDEFFDRTDLAVWKFETTIRGLRGLTPIGPVDDQIADLLGIPHAEVSA